MDDEKRPDEPDDDRFDIEEVVTRFGDVRVRSGFKLEELETGVLGISAFGPIFAFPDSDLESGDEGKQE